jgi:RNA polymerase sigma-70 factor (ECF subfamily)
MGEALPSPGTDSAELAERTALRLTVQDALLALSPEQRFALVLREYDGLSYREIGETMEITEKNARTLACRARNALRKRLASLLEDEK